MTPERPRKGFSCAAVAAGMAFLVALAAAAGVWGYFRFLHYDRVAARHIPQDAVAVARVDVEEGVLYDPVRQHLLPVLMESIGRESPDSLMRRFERATGLGRPDLRELVVARGATWSDWTLVVAGRFPKAAVVPRIHTFLTTEGVTGWELRGTPGMLVHGSSGAVLGQAADGALVLASTATRLAAALPSQDPPPVLRLDVEAPFAFAATAAQLREIASHPAAGVAPGLGELVRVERVRGALQLGSPFEVRVFLDPAPGNSASQLRAGIEHLLAALRTLARRTTGGGFAGERALLERVVVEPGEDDFVAISSSWTRDEVDRGARSLASAIRSWMGSGPKPTP